MPNAVYVIGTMDTKGSEVSFVADAIRKWGLSVRTVDVGTLSEPTIAPDINRSAVLAMGPNGSASLQGPSLEGLDRGQAVERMSLALVEYLKKEYLDGELGGVIGLGGSGGTSLITAALRAIPIGVPKVMVSTVASGNIAPYVGCSDVFVCPSVVDVSGLNAVSTKILTNAANALAGMMNGAASSHPTKPALGMTMFGVTTPCVTGVRQALEQLGYDCLVFHATGVGGQAMEGLVESRFIEGLLDLTTTEVADEVVGGVFPAGAKRFDILATREIPCVMSVGAMDMVNFGAMSTVPEPFKTRKLHIHNSNVTLMRTTPDENRRCAQWMVAKLQRARGPITLLLPSHGVSALDAPGQPFHDPEANAVLFEELERGLEGRSNIRVERVPAHINDAVFIERAIQAFQELRPS